MLLRGRHWVGLWLLAFLVVASIIVARQSAALAVAKRLQALRTERLELEASQADLERRIQLGSSRQKLIPIAERLGLHLPSDSSSRLFAPPVFDRETR